jgi:hypothetical protein
LAHLIDWDAPRPACLTLLGFFRAIEGFMRDQMPTDMRDALRADMERDYRAALVAVANRAVLRDTLRRQALTPDR